MLVCFETKDKEEMLVNTNQIGRVEHYSSEKVQLKTKPDKHFYRYFSRLFLTTTDEEGCEHSVVVAGTVYDIEKRCNPHDKEIVTLFDFCDTAGTYWEINPKKIVSIRRITNGYQITLSSKLVIDVTEEVYDQFSEWVADSCC